MHPGPWVLAAAPVLGIEFLFTGRHSFLSAQLPEGSTMVRCSLDAAETETQKAKRLAHGAKASMGEPGCLWGFPAPRPGGGRCCPTFRDRGF